MKISLPCNGCGRSVDVSKQRYLELTKAGKFPTCRECVRLSRYQLPAQSCERPGGGETAEAARETEIASAVGLIYVEGTGRRRHDLAPLANGRVRRVTARHSGDGVAGADGSE